MFWFDGYDIPFRGFSFQSIRGLIIGHGVFPTADWSGLHLFSTWENASFINKITLVGPKVSDDPLYCVPMKVNDGTHASQSWSTCLRNLEQPY